MFMNDHLLGLKWNEAIVGFVLW